jgi:hypothetical protein
MLKNLFFLMSYSVPLEFPIIKREHFNGWYTATAYHSSLIISDAPIVFLSVTIFVTILYLTTGQLLEINRYLILLSFFLIFSYASQALAIMNTSLLNAQVNILLLEIYYRAKSIKFFFIN